MAQNININSIGSVTPVRNTARAVETNIERYFFLLKVLGLAHINKAAGNDIRTGNYMAGFLVDGYNNNQLSPASIRLTLTRVQSLPWMRLLEMRFSKSWVMSVPSAVMDIVGIAVNVTLGSRQ